MTVRRLTWFFSSSLVILLLLAVGAVWSMHTMYSMARSNIFNELQHSLAPYQLTLDCSDYWEWPTLTQKEYCSVRDDGQQVVFFRQQVRFTPLALNAEFSITPVYKGMHFDGQQGQWTLPIGSEKLQFDAQAEGTISTRKASIKPWRLSGWIDLRAPFNSHVQADFEQLLVEIESEALQFEHLSVSFEAGQQQQGRFIHRTELAFQLAELRTPVDKLVVSGFSLQEDNQRIDDKLTIQATAAIDKTIYATNNVEYELANTQLTFALQQITLNFPKLLKSPNSAVSISRNFHRVVEEVTNQLNNQPLNISVQQADTKFAITTKTERPFFELSSDVRMQGTFNVHQTDSRFNLSVDANDNLMVGPQRELFQEMVEQGWLQPSNGRLHSEVVYKDGKLWANQALISSLKL